MNRLARSRRVIALIAAYAVAVQALLPLASAGASSADFSICASAASAPAPGKSGDHDASWPWAAGCGMLCCVQALAGPPSPGDVAVTARAVPAPLPRQAARLALPSRHAPQAPRAPPAG